MTTREGYYIDLHTGETLPLLMPTAGFDITDVPTPQLVTIPSMALTSTLKVPSNTMLQGAGIGKTVLKSAYNGMLITARGSASSRLKNIVIRDLTLMGNGGSNEYGILIEYADNILIERCELVNIGRRGVGWEEGTTRITVRNCVIDGVGQYHCLSCKDDKGERSANFAVYSNRLVNAGSYGLDVHAEGPGEICGNVIEGTRHGWKFPDCAIEENVFVHHNWVQQSDEGTKIDITLELGAPKRLFFFLNHAMPVFQMKEGAQAIAVENTYHAGSHRVSGATLITDPDAPEAEPIREFLTDTPPVDPPVEPPPIEPPPIEPPTYAGTLTMADGRTFGLVELADE